MLKLSSAFIGKPVISLRTLVSVATVKSALINPNTLKIEGFYCTDRYEKKDLLLLYQNIRDFVDQGLVVDDHDVLTDPADLVRLKKIIDLDFSLIDKSVVTVNRQRMGRVSDYSVEVETMYIQKLYVTQGVLKRLTGGSLSVDRSQINEITDTKIIINDPLEKGAVRAAAAA